MRLLVALAAATLLLPVPARAQDAASGGVADELAQLNATVAESNELLRRLVSHQEATLFVRRLELASARVDEAQQRLTSLHGEQRRVEQERLMVLRGLEQFEQLIDEAESDVARQLELERGNLELELKSTQAELTRLETELINAENELRSRRDRLVELQELLDTAIENLLRKR